MSKRCAKCEKTVYPIEELKCLDKVWHKACFKCWECGMILNMKNYKGYDKKPYCNAHYPKTKHTTVAETPEMTRVTNLSKITSNVQYHKDFEENIKGKKTQVETDPEIERIKANTQVQSQVEYHGLRQRAHDMEQRRGNIMPERRPGVPPHAPSMPSPVVKHDMGEGATPSPYSQRNQTGASVMYNSGGRDPMPPPQQPPQQPYYQPPPPQQPPPPENPAAPMPQPITPDGIMMGAVFRAMYDYEAGDEDEVSFMDADEVIDCEIIDDGWMVGTVRRTGQRGMLPANYVERIK